MLTVRLKRAVTALELRNLDASVGPGPHRAVQLARLRPVFIGSLTQHMLFAIAGLELTPLPNRLRQALPDVARALPGTRAIVTRDPGGRVLVTITGGGTVALTFETRTGALLSASTGAMWAQGIGGTTIAQDPVTSLRAIPHGLRAIPSTIAPSPTSKLAPATGPRNTAFTLRVALGHQPTAHSAPALSAQIFGPTGPGCVYWLSRPPAIRIPAGAVTYRRGLAIATYHVAPAVIGRGRWCSGRYQLMIAPQPRRKSGATVPRTFPPPTSRPTDSTRRTERSLQNQPPRSPITSSQSAFLVCETPASLGGWASPPTAPCRAPSSLPKTRF